MPITTRPILKILGDDITGNYTRSGWSIDKYSPQKGHTIRLYTNLQDAQIKSIIWNFGDDTPTSNKNVVDHVFIKNESPCEGYVTIECTVLTKGKNSKVLTAKRTILIVPQVDCNVDFEQYPIITNDTKSFELVGQVYCAAINLGNPNNGNPNFACGGACPETCPVYETICNPIQNVSVTKYGKHKVKVECGIQGSIEQNSECVDLYKNNYLGENAIYPPTVRRICIDIRPNMEQIELVLSNPNKPKKYLREITINGLSESMLSNNVSVEWKIKPLNTDNYKTRVFTKNKKTIEYNFNRSGRYEITAQITIKSCQGATVTTVITL